MSGFNRFGPMPALGITCALEVTGFFENAVPSEAYSDTLSVSGHQGDFSVFLVSGALPPGATITADNPNDTIVLEWPAAGAGTLDNLGFEDGNDGEWLLGYGWSIITGGEIESGTYSARYNGVGQASALHRIAAPVTPGTTITATARVNKDDNRKDFAGGAVLMIWYTAAMVPIRYDVGNVVNTGANAFQTSTLVATAPANAAFVRLGFSGTRDTKGRAKHPVWVDSLTWDHTFTVGGAVEDEYPITLLVKDELGCQFEWSGSVTVGDSEFVNDVLMVGDFSDGKDSAFVNTQDWTDVAYADVGTFSPFRLVATQTGAVTCALGVAGSGRRYVRSSNTWSTIADGFGSASWFQGSCLDNELFVPMTANVCISDDDGETWTDTTADALNCVAIPTGVVYASRNANNNSYSTDFGATFSDAGDRPLDNSFIFAGSPTKIGIVASVGGTTSTTIRFRDTTTGNSWTSAVTLPTPRSATKPNRMCWSGSGWVVVCENGDIYYKIGDGDWTLSAYAASAALYTCASNGERVLAAGAGGLIIESLDYGVTWAEVEHSIAVTGDIRDLKFMQANDY